MRNQRSIIFDHSAANISHVNLLKQIQTLPYRVELHYISCKIATAHARAKERERQAKLRRIAEESTPKPVEPVGQAPELIRRADAGAVVPPRDPAAMAAAIDALLADPEAARAAGERGRALFEAELTSERMVERVEEALLAVL